METAQADKTRQFRQELDPLPHAAGSPQLPELWGGVECTINRVRNRYYDQLTRNGHVRRVGDLDLFAGLGIRAIRYPIQWERLAPDRLDQIDWSWADERLGRLRELGVRPIVGLTHHGSGPLHTSLVEDSFATGLAEFARLVAERYPWVEAYTPVNEPLTTARFSGLYGHWYPHGRDRRTFARALVTQCRAVILAMRAIRTVNPLAQLVQTEDLGRVYSTPQLAEHANFRNELRWVTYDLLGGRLMPGSPVWSYLREADVAEAELRWFQENPCPPDVLGVNHYLTSDRFLDENLGHYPKWSRGGDETQRFVDIEAVHACPDCPIGTCTLLKQMWQRYQLPVAVTEAHLNSTREEQMRWLYEVWTAAKLLRREGVDVRAVTAWSLLGAFDWNKLVVRQAGFYEPGVFDVRAPRPRPTALANLMRVIGAGKPADHPVLDVPGWWRRPDRIWYPAAEGRASAVSAPTGPALDMRDRSARPLVITGATGTLGNAFARLCAARGIPYHILTRQQMDIADPESVDQALDETKPWALVNAAGYVCVDQAEREPDLCFVVNTKGPALLAAACARHGVSLLTFSSDLVFDGAGFEPYVESAPVAPLNVYGRSKVEAERRVLEILPSALVVRTGAFFGPWDEYNFVTVALRALCAGKEFTAASDAVVSPTYVVDLVHAALDLLIDGEQGIWHLSNRGALTWFDLARQAATLAGLAPDHLKARATQALALPAPRPRYSALGSERGQLLQPIERALSQYLLHRRRHRSLVHKSRRTAQEKAGHPTPGIAAS